MGFHDGYADLQEDTFSAGACQEAECMYVKQSITALKSFWDAEQVLESLLHI